MSQSGKTGVSDPAQLAAFLDAGGIELRGDPSGPVFKGSVVGILRPASEGAGLRVSERHFAVNKGSGEIVARGFGLLDLCDNELCVRPQFKVGEDKTVIRTTVRATDFHGAAISAERLARALAAMGVSAAMDQGAAEAALARARQTGQPVRDVVLAHGRRVVNGRDGFFEQAEGSSPIPNEPLDADHRMRGGFMPVAEGQLIGTHNLPVPGEAGKDVFGREIPAPPVKPCTVTPGEGVLVSEDGREYRAAHDGVISWRGDRVSVLSVMGVQGDVDFSTGDVVLSKGCVHVKGSVLDGFRIEAPGDVFVGGTVCANAKVRSGGSIKIGGGVFGGDTGEIKATGQVVAQFLEHARVVAGGDVLVVQSIVSSDVTSDGNVVCVQGKGVIQGGVIRGGQGVEAKSVGFELGGRTEIHLGLEREDEEHKKLKAEREKLRVIREKLDSVLGAGSLEEVLRRTPKERRGRAAGLLKLRSAVMVRQQRIECALNAQQDACQLTCARPRLRARVVIHPGTFVFASGRVHEVQFAQNAAAISFDPEADAFEIV